MPKRRGPRPELIGLIMLHIVLMEAVVVTLAALLPEEEIDHIQAALDSAAEDEVFRRRDRAAMSVMADEIMTRILNRAQEITGE